MIERKFRNVAQTCEVFIHYDSHCSHVEVQWIKSKNGETASLTVCDPTVLPFVREAVNHGKPFGKQSALVALAECLDDLFAGKIGWETLAAIRVMGEEGKREENTGGPVDRAPEKVVG
jgi:hypothetical protein